MNKPTIVHEIPQDAALHIVLGDQCPAGLRGCVLTLTDPHEVLQAGRLADAAIPVVIHDLHCAPWGAKKCAAFVMSLARDSHADIFVVLPKQNRVSARVIGHLRRACCSH